MDPKVEFKDDIKPIRDIDLYRDCQQVVEIVRDVASESSDRFHFLRPQELRLELLEFG